MPASRTTVCIGLFFLCVLAAPLRAEEPVDLDVVHRIKAEAFRNSHVMDYMHVLADLNGPRVTGSPGYRRAAEAAVAAFHEAGVPRAELESWGHFGRGWSWSRVAVQMKSPQETTLQAFPADWTPGTEGAVSGEVVFAPLWKKGEAVRTDDLLLYAGQIEAWKAAQRGRLRGRIVMMEEPRAALPPPETPAYRYDDKALRALEDNTADDSVQPGPMPRLQWPLLAWPVDREEMARLDDAIPLEFAADRWLLENRLRTRIAAFLREEGVAAVLVPSRAPRAGVIMHSDHGSWLDDDPVGPPTVVLSPESYARIHRLLAREVPVRLDVEVEAEFHPAAEGTNVIAELPGSARGGEVVMLGAHLDSWHGATGATDNAAGSAVVMEAMRILAALDLPLKRSVRAALWDGEEQCLCGSRGYVRKHFADPVTMVRSPEHAKLAAYFNLDNGAGRIRGVYLQQHDAARPILEAWLAPFRDLGVETFAIANTSGTDHLSFDAVGLPGFQFVQDPLDYSGGTHHSDIDDVSRVPPGDLMQAAAVMASTVYHAANRDQPMPRKPLPAPLPPRGELPPILR